MDEMRRRYDVPRRDYGGMQPPAQPSQPAQPQPEPTQSHQEAVHHQTQHHQPAHHPAPTHHNQPAQHQQPVHNRTQSSLRPTTSEFVQAPALHQPQQPVRHPSPQPPHPQTHQTTHHQPTEPVHHRPVPVPESVVAKKSRRKPNLRVVGAITGVAIFLLIAGYFAFKPSKPKVIMPTDLAKQSSFKFYYPSPMPAGYHYNTNQSTFQNGSAYYMLMNGGKHIVVTETSSVGNNNLGKLADSTQFKSPVGNVVLGTEINQTSAYVLAGDTLISIHSYGRIPKAEMTNVINSFKQLGEPAS